MHRKMDNRTEPKPSLGTYIPTARNFRWWSFPSRRPAPAGPTVLAWPTCGKRPAVGRSSAFVDRRSNAWPEPCERPFLVTERDDRKLSNHKGDSETANDHRSIGFSRTERCIAVDSFSFLRYYHTIYIYIMLLPRYHCRVVINVGSGAKKSIGERENRSSPLSSEKSKSTRAHQNPLHDHVHRDSDGIYPKNPLPPCDIIPRYSGHLWSRDECCIDWSPRPLEQKPVCVCASPLSRPTSLVILSVALRLHRHALFRIPGPFIISFIFSGPRAPSSAMDAASALETVRDEDFVEYYLFVRSDTDDAELLVQRVNDLNAKTLQLAERLSDQYIWHKDPFNLIPRFCPSAELRQSFPDTSDGNL